MPESYPDNLSPARFSSLAPMDFILGERSEDELPDGRILLQMIDVAKRRKQDK